MALYFHAEPVERLRARFPAALEKTHDVEAMRLGAAPRPMESRQYVFDFPDGVRLGVSIDDCGRVGRLLHVSASATRPPRRVQTAEVVARVADLWGRPPPPPAYAFYTLNGVSHVLFPAPQEASNGDGRER